MNHSFANRCSRAPEVPVRKWNWSAESVCSLRRVQTDEAQTDAQVAQENQGSGPDPWIPQLGIFWKFRRTLGPHLCHLEVFTLFGFLSFGVERSGM